MLNYCITVIFTVNLPTITTYSLQDECFRGVKVVDTTANALWYFWNYVHLLILIPKKFNTQKHTDRGNP